MVTKEMWHKIQQAMGYTDKEMALALASPFRKKVLAAGPLLVRRKIVAEAVEAKNCAAHPQGTKYVIRANGVIRKDEAPQTMCVGALAALAPVCQMVTGFIALGQDPKEDFEYYVHCPDAGVDNGGWGRVLFKVTVE